MGGQGTKCHRNIEENYNCLTGDCARALPTTDRQTTMTNARETAYDHSITLLYEEIWIVVGGCGADWHVCNESEETLTTLGDSTWREIKLVSSGKIWDVCCENAVC